MEFPQTGEAPSPFGAPDASAGGGFPNTGPIPMDLPTPGSTEPQPFGGLAGTPAPLGGPAPAAIPPMPMEAPAPIAPPPAKKKGKGMLIAVIGIGVLSMGVGAAFYLGFLDGLLGKKKPAEPPPQAALPEEPPKPEPAEAAQTGLPDRSQDAVEFVKSYMPTGASQNLSALLEGPNPAPGMSPWTVDHVSDARYAVSYYDGAAAAKKPKYRFEVNLDARSVSGLDAATTQFLESAAKPPAALMPAPEPKRKRRPKKAPATDRDNLLKDPLGSMLRESSLDAPDEEKPAGRPARKAAREEAGEEGDEEAAEPPKPVRPAKKARKAAAKAPVEKGENIDEILAAADEPAREPAKPKASRSEGAPDELIDEEAPPAPAPKKGGKPAKKSKEEVTLDELLLPGVPQR